MNTPHAPQLVARRGLGPVRHAARDGPHRARELALLAAGVVTVALLAVLLARAFTARPAANPASPANPENPAPPIPVTLAAPMLATTYGDQDVALTATLGAGGAAVGSGSVTFAILDGDRAVAAPIVVPVNPAMPTVAAPLPAGLAAGTYTVRVTYGGGTGFDGATLTTSLTVAQRPVAVTLPALALTATYDGTARGVVPQTEVAGLSVTVAYSRDGVPVAAPVGAGTYGVTATVADANYRGSATGTLVIERATPAVAWQPPASITYGTPLGAAQLNATAALGGDLAYAPPLGTILPAGNGQALTATFTPPDTANYRTVAVTVPITVTKAPLTVAAADATRRYGAGNPPLAATPGGFVNGEDAAVLEGAPQLTTVASPGSPVGTYPIAAARGTLSAANYAFTFTPGTLTVTPAPLTAAAHDATRVYGAPEPAFTGTLVGVVNDDPIGIAYLADAAVSSPVGQYPIRPLLTDPAGRLGNYQVSGTPGVLTVVPAGTTATALEALADEGQTATLRAQVAPAAPAIVTPDEGQVTFTIRRGGAIIGKPVAVAVKLGVAALDLPLGDLDSGTYTVAVAYGGGGNFTGSAGSGALVVANVAPAATLVLPNGAVPEGSAFTVALTKPFDPSAGDTAAGFTYAFDRGDGQGFGPATAANGVTIVARDDAVQVVRARISDRDGGTTTYTARIPIANVAPAVRITGGPTFTARLGEFVALQGSFGDPGLLDRHTAVWSWGDGEATAADAAASDGQGTVLGHHLYGQPGVYAATLTVTDDSNGSGAATFGFVAVVGPAGGLGYGTGTFATTRGTAALGLLAGYPASGATLADLQFQFRDGDLRLVATGPAAIGADGAILRVEGAGIVNGTRGYRFRLVASDGQWPGGDGSDRIRLAIWDPAGALVYDTQPGAAPNAAPAAVLAAGDIVVHAVRTALLDPSLAIGGNLQLGLTER